MHKKLKKYLTLILKIALTAGALYLVFRKIELNEIGSILKHSKISLIIVALALFVLSKTVAAFRLNSFLRAIQINIPNTSNLKLYLLGMFYNLFLPGGIGGDGYKIYVLNKKFNVKGKVIFTSLLVDRLSGMLALCCLAIVLSLFIAIPIAVKNVIWILIPSALIGAYYLLKKLYPRYRAIYTKTTSQSFLVQISQTICALSILLALKNHENISAYIFLFLISSIVATIPFTIGGIGSREITFLYGAEFLGLDINISITLSLLFYVITAFTSFFGIWYNIRPDKMQLN